MTANNKNEFNSLRKRAESQIKKKDELDKLSDLEIAELIHELQVHHVELEIQNEQLRQTQGEVLASRQRFADLFHRAPVGYLVLDENGFVKDVNETFCKMTDQISDRVVNHTIFDLIVETDRNWFMARFRALYKKPENKNMELELLTGGAAKLPVSLNAVQYVAPDADDSNVSPLLLLTVTDISERKRSESTLRFQAAMLQNIAEGISLVGLYDGIIKYTNPRFESMFGYEPGELLGKNVAVLNAPTEKSPDEISAAIIDVLKSDGEWHGEINNIKKDSTRFWCYADVSLFEHPEFGEVVISVHSDITEQKLADQALQERTDLLATVFESSPNILMLVDEDGRVERINRTGSEFAGSSQEELLGLLGGEVFQCVNAFNGQGCGRNAVCADCPVRTRMRRSFQKGETILNEEGRLIVWKDAQQIPMDFLISTVPVMTASAVKVLITIVDITERKRSEEHVRHQAHLLENVSDAIISTDSNFAIESWNRAAQEIYGWEESEVLGKTVEEVLKSDFQAPLNQVIENFYKEGSWKGEALQYRKDGSPISVLSSVRLLQDEQGDLLRAIATNRDITERKQAEEALQRSELQNRMILQTALDGFWIVDPESGKILEVNDAYCQMSGYRRDELLQMKVADLDIVETVEDVDARAKKILMLGGDRFESAHRRKDGSIFQVEISIKNLQNDGGRNFAFIHDITERKRFEDALRESEKQYRQLFDEMLSGFALHEIICDDRGKPIDYRFLAVNSAFEELTGLRADEIVGKMASEALPVVEPFWVERYGKVALEDTVDQFEGYSAGAGKYYEARAFCPEAGKFAVVFHDVTNSKKAEEALKKSEANLKKAQHFAHVGSWTWDIKTNQLEWSDEMYNIFGIDQKKFTGSLSDVLANAIHPDDLPAVEQSNLSVIHEKKPIPLEYRVIWPDGSVHTVWAEAGELLTDENDMPTYLSGIVQDITERKQAENALREAEELYRTIIATSPDGIATATMDGTITLASKRMLELFGAKSTDKFIGLTAFDFIAPEDHTRAVEDLNKVSQGEDMGYLQYNMRRMDGSLFKGEVSSSVFHDGDGNPLGIITLMRDVTERELKEETLRRYLSELEALSENAAVISKLQEPHQIGQKIVDVLGRYLSWHHVAIRLRNADDFELIAFNQPGLTISGREQAERRFTSAISKVGQGLSGLAVQTGKFIRAANVDEYPQYVNTHPDIRSGMYAPLKIGERVIGCISVESEKLDAFTERDEKLLDALAAQAAVSFENANLYQRAQAELHERQRAETAQLVALTKYKTLFNTMPLGITVSDSEGKIIESNLMSENILGISQQEHNRRTIDSTEWNLVRPDGTLMPPSEYASVRALKEKRLVENIEVGIIKSEDEIAWLSVTADVLPLDGYGVVIAYSDISERKRSEEELKRLLQEKEILLAEVHHRVKNNLQVVTSLLNLQTEGVKDPVILGMLEESRNRIQSMTLVHEQLYRAKEYARIDFGIYADQLVSTLFSMYEVDANQIQFELDADLVYLELDKAIPCGLILNELITNSLKYAFPDNKKGKLWVNLKPVENKMMFQVGDNGVGIPEDVDFDTTQTLGLQLVKLLCTHDLHGSVKVMRNKGTQFQIEFPVLSPA